MRALLRLESVANGSGRSRAVILCNVPGLRVGASPKAAAPVSKLLVSSLFAAAVAIHAAASRKNPAPMLQSRFFMVFQTSERILSRAKTEKASPPVRGEAFALRLRSV